MDLRILDDLVEDFRKNSGGVPDDVGEETQDNEIAVGTLPVRLRWLYRFYVNLLTSTADRQDDKIKQLQHYQTKGWPDSGLANVRASHNTVMFQRYKCRLCGEILAVELFSAITGGECGHAQEQEAKEFVQFLSKRGGISSIFKYLLFRKGWVISYNPETD